MTTRQMIEHCMKEFESGKKLVEIPCDKPKVIRHRLHAMARKQGLLWGFATMEKSIFVIQ